MDFCPQDTNLHLAFQLSILFGASAALSNRKSVTGNQQPKRKGPVPERSRRERIHTTMSLRLRSVNRRFTLPLAVLRLCILRLSHRLFRLLRSVHHPFAPLVLLHFLFQIIVCHNKKNFASALPQKEKATSRTSSIARHCFPP